jgi:hypothetical protein
MGNYHHHQNPSAFNLDLNVISNVCDAYPSDGLYVINPTQHSPLLGFAYDGFPIYGAYAYTNTDGTGEITRMQSSYQLKNQTTRTNGPNVGIFTMAEFVIHLNIQYHYIQTVFIVISQRSMPIITLLILMPLAQRSTETNRQPREVRSQLSQGEQRHTPQL